MNYYTLLKKGTSHPVFCEDFLYTKMISDDIFIGAVFDGCSGGDNSHFASSLAGKLMRNVCENIDNSEFEKDLDAVSDSILTKFFTEFQKAQTIFNLKQDDLLSTVILLIYQSVGKNALIRVFGDGFVAADSKHYIIDQNNMPEYPIYYLTENFKLPDIKSQRYFFQNVSDVTISTDGILTFKQEGIPENAEIPDPVEYLVQNSEMQNLGVMLQRKYNILNNKYKIRNSDDVAVIRVRFD